MWLRIKSLFSWANIVKFISSLVPEILKKYLVPVTLRALGLAGGFWATVAYFFVTYVWSKIRAKWAKWARKADKKLIDDANIVKYKADKAAGAPVEKLIEDETNLLNGTRPK